MKESLGELVGGYRQAPHASYSFNTFIIDESICFEEEYDYFLGKIITMHPFLDSFRDRHFGPGLNFVPPIYGRLTYYS